MDIPIQGGTPVEGSLRRVIILREGSQAEDLDIVAGEGSDTFITIVVMPGVSTEMTVRVDIVGEGARVRLAGLYVCGSEEKVRLRTVMRHRSGGSTSDQIFTGIAGGRSRVAFEGTIIVAPDAQGTEAYQQSRNLLLGEDAKVDTLPQLEIYADDVKCSHGATVGSLSEDEQFYMRSRGVPEAEAKVLQMMSFLSPVLKGLPEEEALMEELENAIRSAL